MDKELAKTSEEILFVKIDNDGFNLGAQRNAVKGGQLEEAIAVIHAFVQSDQNQNHNHAVETTHALSVLPHALSVLPPHILNSKIAHAVPKSEIAKNGDYNLSGERYKNQPNIGKHNFESIEIGEIIEFQYGKPLKKENRNDGPYPVYGSNGIVGWHSEFIAKPPFIVVGRKGSAGALHYSELPGYPIDTTFYIEDNNPGKINLKYAFHILGTLNLDKVNIQAGIPGLNRNDAYKLQIPLPPISVQQEIVSEIEGYQKIIDGAKMVVENYKPKLDIDPDWEMVALESICTKLGDGLHGTPEYSNDGEYYFINGNNLLDSKITIKESTKRVTKEEFEKYKKLLNDRTILVSINGTLGNVAIYNKEKVVLGKSVCYINLKNDINKDFIKIYLQSENFLDYAHKMSTGSTIQNVSLQSMRSFTIPIPKIEIQRQIVAQIEKEQQLVNANKQLIEIFEQKIKDRIAKVWGE